MAISCRVLFEESCLCGVALQDAVYSAFPGGECEAEQVSSHSHGPVQDEEVLTKLIVDPIHYDRQTGQISPLAFNDATTLDLSLFREVLATDAEIQLAINEIIATGKKKDPIQNRTIQIVLQATAGQIRTERFESPERRMCMVYDTAEPEKPAHASVFTPTEARKGASQRRVRRALHDLFMKTPVRLEDYRSLSY